MAKQLTMRQRLFSEAYAKTGDMVGSARQAGYSESTARTGMREVLRRPAVAAYVEECRRQATCGAVDGSRVLAEMEAIAYADVGDFMRMEDGKLVIKDLAELLPAQRAAIASIKEGTRGMEVKFYDKMHALEALGKKAGVLGEKEKDAPGEGALEVRIEVIE